MKNAEKEKKVLTLTERDDKINELLECSKIFEN
jgi:hypothetical protein